MSSYHIVYYDSCACNLISPKYSVWTRMNLHTHIHLDAPNSQEPLPVNFFQRVLVSSSLSYTPTGPHGGMHNCKITELVELAYILKHIYLEDFQQKASFRMIRLLVVKTEDWRLKIIISLLKPRQKFYTNWHIAL